MQLQCVSCIVLKEYSLFILCMGLVSVTVPLQLVHFGREINKAFCGFYDQSRSWQHQRLFQDDELCRTQIDQDVKGPVGMSRDSLLVFVFPQINFQ